VGDAADPTTPSLSSTSFSAFSCEENRRSNFVMHGFGERVVAVLISTICQNVWELSNLGRAARACFTRAE
jgi:hypothetical protein